MKKARAILYSIIFASILSAPPIVFADTQHWHSQPKINIVSDNDTYQVDYSYKQYKDDIYTGDTYKHHGNLQSTIGLPLPIANQIFELSFTEDAPSDQHYEIANFIIYDKKPGDLGNCDILANDINNKDSINITIKNTVCSVR